ncbi:hypothetical protein Emag_004158 [Eimeria magna]
MKSSKSCKGCELKTVDFSDPAATAQEINSFVKGKTGGHFEKTVDASALSEKTQMVLASSLLLKAPWEVPFDAQTEEGPFLGLTSTGEQTQTVQYLKRSFKDDQYGFFPSRYVGRRVPEIPKFKLSAKDHQADLAPILKRLGVRNMLHEGFSEPALLAKSRAGLFVSNFFHQADFAVTAAGTEGTAYKEVPPPSGPMRLRPIPTTIDKPFLFTVVFIDEGKPPNFLLIGRVVNIEGNQSADMQQEKAA